MKTQLIKSLITCCILNVAVCIQSNAQIVYTSIIPNDTLVCTTLVTKTYQLDLNNDSVNDFDFTATYSSNGTCSSGGFPFPMQRPRRKTITGISSLNTSFFFGRVNTNPVALNYGDSINNNYIWETNLDTLYYRNYYFTSCSSLTGAGNWNSATDRYLPVKFVNNGDNYYGWIRMNISTYGAGIVRLIFKGYAYNSVANEPFLAGQTTASVLSVIGNKTICGGDSTTLLVAPGSSFLWSTGDTTPSITVSPLTTTNYTVTVINSIPGDTATLSQQIIVNYADTAVTRNCDTLRSLAIAPSTFQWMDCGSLLPLAGDTNKIFKPVVDGDYAVIINYKGCVDTSVCNYVHVANFAVSNSDTICQGNTTTITASGGTSYLWSTGQTTAGITVSPASTTNYYVTITDSLASCPRQLIQKTTVIPSIFITRVSNTLNTSNYSGATYQWIDCGTMLPVPGANSFTYTPVTGGSYAVILNYSCIDTSACFNFSALGISENESNAVFSIAPNPLNQHAIINWKLNTKESVAIKLFDVDGRLVRIIADHLFNAGSHQIELNAENIIAGIYFLKIETENYSVTKKLSIIK